MAHNIDDMVAENEREDSFRGVGSSAWRNQEQQPSDWDGALRSQQIDTMRRQEEARNAALAEQMNANRGVFDGYMQIGNHMAAQKRQQVNNANAHLASALRLSAMNGGNLPQYSWGGIGAALGIDPQRGAIIGGGFDRNSGKFRLQLASADRLNLIKQLRNAGQPIPDELGKPQELEFTPQQQYSLMLASPGVFSRHEVEGMRNELINTYHMHPDQVPPVPIGWGETGRVGIGNATATGGTSVNPAWLYGPQRRANISAFGANGRGGFTSYESSDETGHRLMSQDFGTRAQNTPTWKLLSSGPDGKRYENAQTGEVVNVRPGQTITSATNGASEKERIAQIAANGKLAAEEMKDRRERDIAAANDETKRYGIERSAQSRESVAEGRASNGRLSEKRFDAKAYSALKEEYDELTTGMDGEKKELTPDEQKMASRLKARMDEMLGVGDESAVTANAVQDQGVVTPDGAARALQRRIAARNQAQATGGTQDAAQTPQGGQMQQQGQEVANPNAKPVVNKSAAEIAADRNRQTAPARTAPSGDMTAAQIVQKRNAGKPKEGVGGNEQKLRDEENDRIRRMTEMGGEVTDERGGKRRVKIANWDYLSDDEKRLWPEYSSKLTEDVVMAQRLANEAKERWEAQWGENSEWYKREVDEIQKQAEKRHPDNAEQRRRYVEKKIERLKARSRGENPTFKRELEDSRFSAFISD